MSTYTFNGTTWTTIQSGQSYSFQLTWTLTFDKAGTYTETITAIGSGNSLYTETNKGNWWFGAKNKNAEYKNKETVVMQETSSTNSNGNAIQYSGVDCPLYLKILDKLSSKEMVTIEDGSTTSTSINNSTGIYTWKKQ